MLPILTPEEIKQPKVIGLIPEEKQDERDWVLGAVEEPLNSKGDWRPYVTEFELQRNGIFDPWNCVTQSAWNKIQCLANLKYGLKLNKSKRFTSVMSGTLPGRGNSVTNVVENIRKVGGVEERDYITMRPDMTEQEFYQAIPQEVTNKENFKQLWNYNHAWLAGNRQDIIANALTISPVMVSVNGRYEYDKNGYVKQDQSGVVTHEVLIVAAEPGKFWYVLDSENDKGFVRFAWDYIFIAPKIGYLTYLSSMMVYKKKGEPALYFHNPKDNKLVPFADGQIVGGDLFKLFFGSYANMHIQTVEKLPFDVAHYSITTK